MSNDNIKYLDKLAEGIASRVSDDGEKNNDDNKNIPHASYNSGSNATVYHASTVINVNSSSHSQEDKNKPIKEKRQDEEAVLQGRRRVQKRRVGQRVAIRHMTPKEYRNFYAGLWDGIETRDGFYDYEAWDFSNGCPEKKAYAKNETLLVDRREKRQFVYKNDQRKSGSIGRRRNEILAKYIHEIMILLLLSFLIPMCVFSMIKG